jgi:hypothetical protein
MSAACRPPAPAEAQQRQLARVDAALDGHHAQRAHHLGVGDAADALGALQRLELEAVRESLIACSAASRSSVMSPPSEAPAGSRPSSRLASVTVGSVPPWP